MDINMPELDGFETTKKICEIIGRDSGIWIIALTAMPWSELSEDLENAGLTHYIQKPIDRTNLETALNMFL
jgi:CheY-like chemotaxis protein